MLYKVMTRRLVKGVDQFGQPQAKPFFEPIFVEAEGGDDAAEAVFNSFDDTARNTLNIVHIGPAEQEERDAWYAKNAPVLSEEPELPLKRPAKKAKENAVNG